MAGKLHREPVCVSDIEAYAHDTLPRNALDYYRSGANDEVSLQDNLAAFRRYVYSSDRKYMLYTRI